MKIGKFNQYKENYVSSTVTDVSTSSNNTATRKLWGNTDTGTIDITNSIYVTGNMYAYVPDADKDEEDEEDSRSEYNPYEPDTIPETRTPPFEEEEEKYNGCFIADDGFIGKRGEFNDNSYSKTVYFDYPERTENDPNGKTNYDNKKDLLDVLKMLVPVGSIIMHNGSVTKDVLLSYGWAVCDGSNGTPNLTGKFIKGGTSAGTTGGSSSVTLTTSNLPSHNHTATTTTTVNLTKSSDTETTVPNRLNNQKIITYGEIFYQAFDLGGDKHYTAETGYESAQDKGIEEVTVNDLVDIANSGNRESYTATATSTTTIGNTGSGSSFNIEPPYYTLIYIMRVK